MPVCNGFGNANFSVFFAGFSFRKIKRLLKKPPLYQLVGGGGGKQGVVGGEMQSGSRSVWSAVAAVSLLSPAHVPMATSNGKVAVGASQSAPDPSTRRSQDDVLAGELLLHQGGLRHQVQHHKREWFRVQEISVGPGKRHCIAAK